MLDPLLAGHKQQSAPHLAQEESFLQDLQGQYEEQQVHFFRVPFFLHCFNGQKNATYVQRLGEVGGFRRQEYHSDVIFRSHFN